MNDIPEILNSINEQLKRIADHLDKQNKSQDKSKIESSDISKSILDSLKLKKSSIS